MAHLGKPEQNCLHRISCPQWWEATKIAVFPLHSYMEIKGQKLHSRTQEYIYIHLRIHQHTFEIIFTGTQSHIYRGLRLYITFT